MIIICKRLTPQGLSVWTQIYRSLVIASCWSKTGISPDVWGLFGRTFGTKAWENRSYIGAKFYCNKKFRSGEIREKTLPRGKKVEFYSTSLRWSTKLMGKERVLLYHRKPVLICVVYRVHREDQTNLSDPAERVNALINLQSLKVREDHSILKFCWWSGFPACGEWWGKRSKSIFSCFATRVWCFLCR